MQIDENRISDLEIYLIRMQRSILDKMFFVDKVFEPFDTIVDFGCANGELIKAMSQMFPEYRYVGYDISPEMIGAAKKNVPGAQFCTSWDELGVSFESSLLNISSTIHEVWSYGTPESIAEFRERAFRSGFRYICIRDMMFDDSLDRPADAEQLSAVRASADYAGQLADFESVRGEIKTQKQLVHYLLKYKYTQNWEREVREDYFPVSEGELLAGVEADYRTVFCEKFTLPYTRWQIGKDFGFTLRDTTHIKVILEHK
ncbi:MAG: methyltransferase domain-containing protein [Ruminococcus sp.]|nr:methyltransferase domain-containing protein [Ruminococcus sp.]